VPNVTPESGLPRALPVPQRANWYVRASLIVMGLAFATVFGIAMWLNPYTEDGKPRSMATHRQLGIPECSFVAATGKPCPSCGMTTSFALLVRGDVRASLAANWVGTLLASFWAVLMVWAVASGIRGRTLFVPRGYGNIIATGIVGVFLILLMVRWGVVLLT
jgi:hypothetical protein